LNYVEYRSLFALNIPTVVPLVYELDEQLNPIKHYYLGDPEAIAKKTAAVAAQEKSKKILVFKLFYS